MRALSNTAVFALLIALAAPAMASAALSRETLDGTWESPWPPDVLPKPGAPPRPVETTPPPLKPQYLAAWKAQQKAAAEASARGDAPVNGASQCIPPGMPSMMNPGFPVEVLLSHSRVTVINEQLNQIRRIYLDEPQMALDDAEPWYQGHSVGHWEGNVLVVDTIGLKDVARMSGVPHSANMRIDERLEPTSLNTFEDHITVTDPEYLTGPWSWTYHYRRKPGYKIEEFVCENNRVYADPKTGGQRIKLEP
jgi:hypothetical protein